jgi:hypothetical protein
VNAFLPIIFLGLLVILYEERNPNRERIAQMGKWHVVSDPQYLEKKKGIFVRQTDEEGNEIQPIGNIARVINGATASNFNSSGNIKPEMQSNITERCAVCRLETGKEEFGIFVQGVCVNCGAPENGIGIPNIDFNKMIERLEEEGEECTEGEELAKDGLPRKVYLRDELLFEAGVIKGTHFSKVEYREILDEEKIPEGVNGKCKYFKLIGFKEEESPLTLREIEELIGFEQIVVWGE